MTVYGFHASHEQISPRQLLAEQAGFQAAMCSDHLEPWSSRQGHSGLAWAWLGAALATTDLTFGTVTAPGQRYHPAVVAQAIATLGQMYPGRFWTALGTGQHANEHVTGEVTVKLYKGLARVVARTSPNALYDADLAGFGESGGTFSQAASPGFIELFTLQSRMAHRVRERDRG